MIHIFDTDIAVKYGLKSAIILQNIYYWVSKNEANEVNFKDGRYWTYNSIKAFVKLFPYMTEKQIRSSLKILIDEGLIITGKFNDSPYVHTLWYAITEKGMTILQKSNYDLPFQEDRFALQGKTLDSTYIHNKDIQNKNTKENTNNKHLILSETEEILAFLNEKAHTAYRATTRKTQVLIEARLKEGFTVEDFKKVISNKCTEWMGTEWEKFLRPETLFGTKFENYLNAPPRRSGQKASPYHFMEREKEDDLPF